MSLTPSPRRSLYLLACTIVIMTIAIIALPASAQETPAPIPDPTQKPSPRAPPTM